MFSCKSNFAVEFDDTFFWQMLWNLLMECFVPRYDIKIGQAELGGSWIPSRLHVAPFLLHTASVTWHLFSAILIFTINHLPISVSFSYTSETFFICKDIYTGLHTGKDATMVLSWNRASYKWWSCCRISWLMTGGSGGCWVSPSLLKVI